MTNMIQIVLSLFIDSFIYLLSCIKYVNID